jgi:8-oxo-dGTP pyrophosphatase MutT (NUDIX family)
MSEEKPYRPVAAIVVFREPLIQGTYNEENDSNLESLNRKLNERIYLIVKKPREDHAWQFPQGGLKKKLKETIAQGALRELSEECGSDLKVDLIDNREPCCIYQYRYPEHFVKTKKRGKQFSGPKVIEYRYMELKFETRLNVKKKLRWNLLDLNGLQGSVNQMVKKL